VLDLTERKRAEAEARESERRYREVEMALAHANRVTTIGQLAASITHEVKQPIGAAATNAAAGLRWLSAQPPNIEEARETFARILKDATRAGEVMNRIRGLVKNAPPCRETLQLNEAIREVVAMTHGDAERNNISVQTELAEDLPFIDGDRVQLQQVMLNLIINAIEAMSTVDDGPRELLIGTSRHEQNGVLVTVSDSGPGVAPENAARLFEPFFTTKASGMGIGLSICGSIVQAHGGALSLRANIPRGAVFQFTLPAHADRTPSSSREQSTRCGQP
jgi:C4-dicarboxylate-specific signal transduction histidine kinase